MDNFGDLLGGLSDMLGDMLGAEAGAEGAEGLAALFSSGGRREPAAPVVYERYLCGGPRDLDINDR